MHSGLHHWDIGTALCHSTGYLTSASRGLHSPEVSLTTLLISHKHSMSVAAASARGPVTRRPRSAGFYSGTEGSRAVNGAGRLELCNALSTGTSFIYLAEGHAQRRWLQRCFSDGLHAARDLNQHQVPVQPDCLV